MQTEVCTSIKQVLAIVYKFALVCRLTVISSLVPRKTLKTLPSGLGLNAFLVMLVLAVLCAKGFKMITFNLCFTNSNFQEWQNKIRQHLSISYFSLQVEFF